MPGSLTPPRAYTWAMAIAFLLLSAALFAQQPTGVLRSQPQAMNDSDGPRLESALNADPDDLVLREQLLTFYSETPNRDPNWANRFRLITWVVENHPEAVLSGRSWMGMPAPLYQQLKQTWVNQVQQHPDNPRILRNAANFMDGTPNAIRVGGNVAAANLIRKVDPPYPSLALQARVQGTVKFTVTIGEDGHVLSVQLVSGHPLLVAPATQAVEQWVYKPTLLNGQAVRVLTTVDVIFSLDGPPGTPAVH